MGRGGWKWVVFGAVLRDDFEMNKRKIILLTAMFFVVSAVAYAFTFIDDTDTDFTNGNLSVNSRVIGSEYLNSELYYQALREVLKFIGGLML